MAANRTRWEIQGLLKEAWNRSREAKHRHIITITVLATLAFVAVVHGSYTFISRPQGRITHPGNRATIQNRLIELEGYTKDLPSDRHYIWITRDAPDQNLCWPERRNFTINDQFKAKIDERGTNKRFMVSLYAINRDYHEQI